MKLILAALLFGSFAIARTEPRIDIDENHHPEVKKPIDGKYDPDDSDEKVKQEEQESKMNDDFDPELDGIDDDLTTDEGMDDD